MIGRRLRIVLTLAAWGYILLGLVRSGSVIVSAIIRPPDLPYHVSMVSAWERIAWSIGETLTMGGILLVLLSIDYRLERKT